ncbi:MAG: SapC family protein [Woeseiaceae bacterium]
MTKHVLLDNITHKDLRVMTEYTSGRGYDVNVARVFPVEFGQLQAEYPLFFIKNSESGHFDTIALLGFADNENLYLTNGGWDAASLPLTIERLPFLIGFQEQDVEGVPAEVPVVHIDLDHPGAGDEAGERVFLEHGGESPYLERITSVLMTIHQGQEISQAFSNLLVGLELIESLAVDIEFDDGSRQGLAGLHTINEEKLRMLNGSALEALHKQGHLQSIYMILASMPNLSRLIARKNQSLKS